MVSIIAAVDQNMGIGFQNQLLYWLPNDLKHFKSLTTGHTIVMGRKTFESLPKGALPNRRNIVLTSDKTAQYPGADTFSSLEEVIDNCQKDEHLFIIGGESVYRQAINLANTLYLTEIDGKAGDVDAYFPSIDKKMWKEKSREIHPIDEKHPCSYAFVEYVRK